MQQMLRRIIAGIDQLNHWIGEKAIWFTLCMIIAQFAVVVISKTFGYSFTPLNESVWYFNGLIFMLGAAYTLLNDRHVRVDIFYREASDHFRALIDLIGALIFLLPVTFMTFGLSWNFVLDSWYNFNTGQWVLERAEGSSASLPLLSAYKTVIWVYSFLLALAAISLAAKAILFFKGNRRPYDPTFTEPNGLKGPNSLSGNGRG